jgi:hypothetical protein
MSSSGVSLQHSLWMEILMVLIAVIVLVYLAFNFLHDCAYNRYHCFDSKINYTKMCAHAECGITPIIGIICDDTAIMFNNTCDCTLSSYNNEVCKNVK